MENKVTVLVDFLKKFKSAVLAFSGGVDSTFLAKVASEVYGENLLVVTATSSTYPFYELEEAKALAELLGIKHRIIVFEELDIPGYTENPPDRCYYCKNELFGRIRFFSAGLKLPTANKQSYACLASRFPYGEKITKPKLDRLAVAEFEVRKLGFTQFRIRSHENLARMEFVPAEMDKAWEAKERLSEICRKSGFNYFAIDLVGYRTGSMNEVLSDSVKQIHLAQK